MTIPCDAPSEAFKAPKLESFRKEYLARDFRKSTEKFLSRYLPAEFGDLSNNDLTVTASAVQSGDGNDFQMVPAYFDYLEVETSGVNYERIAQVEALLAALKQFDDLPGNPKPKPRHRFQKRYHLLCVIALLPKLFGDTLDASLPELIRRTKLPIDQRVHQNVLAAWPRRWGKTTAQAMFGAGVAYAIPESVGSVYSTGIRAAEMLTKKAAWYLRKLDPTSKIFRGKERVSYTGSDGTERIINSYPSNPEVCNSPRLFCYASGTERGMCV